MTIPGGHAVDALCYIVGEFAELTARVTTRIPMWKHAVTGEDFPVDAPDTVTVAGLLKNGGGSGLSGRERALQRERYPNGDIWPKGDAGADVEIRQYRAEPALHGHRRFRHGGDHAT